MLESDESLSFIPIGLLVGDVGIVNCAHSQVTPIVFLHSTWSCFHHPECVESHRCGLPYLSIT